MKICIYGASKENIDKIYIEKSYEFGALLAQRGHTMIFGGGATGLMGATARGIMDNKGEITGIAPKYFDRPGILIKDYGTIIYTDTISERKNLLIEMADAFVVLPGGVGTFDEFFVTLVMKQLGELNKPIALYSINGYYDALEELINRAKNGGFVSERVKKLYGIYSTPDEILEYIEFKNEQK